MRTKPELEEYLKKVIDIYMKSYEYYNCLLTLDKHAQKQYSNSIFFNFIHYSSWYILVIELCKIFQKSSNQHYNIYHFTAELIKTYHDLEYKSTISLAKVKKIEYDITSAEVMLIVKKIKDLRNKFFAHTDRDYEKIVREINIDKEEIEKLFNLFKSFIIDMRGSLCGEIDLETNEYVNLDDILTAIEEHRQRKNNEIVKNFNEFIKRTKNNSHQ